MGRASDEKPVSVSRRKLGAERSRRFARRRRPELAKAVVLVFPSFGQACAHAAKLFFDCAQKAIRSRGHFTAALSGGSTPKPLYALLAKPPYGSRPEWKKTHIFQADERCVPSNHPDSNARMIRRTLLSKVPLPGKNFHAMNGAADNPRQAAIDYERTLREYAETSLDLILLGLGEDGHTASLFPGASALGEKKRWVAAEDDDAKKGLSRISLTLPFINRAKDVLFLIEGARKKKAFAALLSGQKNIPAAQVTPKGSLAFLVDEAVVQ